MFGRLALGLCGALAITLSACATVGQCPKPHAYCKGNIRHYCVSHAGSVVPDFTVNWETQDCGAEGSGLRCVEDGDDAYCQ